MTGAPNPEVHPLHTPVVSLPTAPIIPRRRLQRLVNLFPPGQFLRYLCVGVFNTFFGYATYVVGLTLLNSIIPARFLYIATPLAVVLTTPVNITVAYFGYKIFVFRTKGNHLTEWLKCFAVYGTGMLPGLLALSALTRLLQALFHTHAAPLHAMLLTMEKPFSGSALAFIQHIATGKAMAGYLAGGIFMASTTIFSFVGHKNVTFKSKPAT